MHPLSIAHLSALDATPAELIAIASKCGFDYVGLRLLPVTADEAPSTLVSDRTLRAATVARARDSGVGILDVELFKLTPTTHVLDLERALAAAQELGARHALTQIHDSDEARATENFIALCDLAASYQLTCEVEFLSWTHMLDLAAAKRLLLAAGKANGGVCLDTLHFWRSKCRLAEIDQLPKQLLRFIQVSDAKGALDVSHDEMIRVAREDRALPGEGQIDLKGIIARLPAGIPLAIEIPNAALARTMPHVERMALAKAKLSKILSAIEAEAA